MFDGAGDILEKIDKVANNYCDYQKRISISSGEEVVKKYYDFISAVFEDARGRSPLSRKEYRIALYKLQLMMNMRNIQSKFRIREMIKK